MALFGYPPSGPLDFLPFLWFTNNMKNTNDLAQRVADHYNACLEVNSSWRNFTNLLGTLNTLNVLDEENYEFVVELLQDSEKFEGESFEDLLLAVGEYLSDVRVAPELIYSNDLVEVMEETGFSPEEVANLAMNAGVSNGEINDFLE